MESLNVNITVEVGPELFWLCCGALFVAAIAVLAFGHKKGGGA